MKWQPLLVRCLCFACLACRNPDGVRHRPPEPQVVEAGKEVEPESALVEQPKEAAISVPAPARDGAEVSQDALKGSIPDPEEGDSVIDAEKGEVEASPAPQGDGAEGAEASTAVQIPAAQGDLPPVPRNLEDQGKPGIAGGNRVLAPNPVTPSAVVPKAPEALRITSDDPKSQAALALVARTDKDWTVRLAAVEGLNNQAILALIATSDQDVDVRKLAVSRLKVQAALRKVATTDPDWSVRYAAVAMLTDQGALAEIAANDGDADIRKLAVSRLIQH